MTETQITDKPRNPAFAKLPALLNLQTLLLNADYQPLNTFPLSLIPTTEAITRLWKERAQTVDTWKDAFGEDRVFRSPSHTIAAPKVLVLREYVHVSAEPKFSRRNLFLRDRFDCQYCGKRFSSNDLTFDHVIPRAQGGRTVWTNILACCEPCNSRKADSMPKFSGRKGRSGSGLRPLKTPYQPTNAELMKAGLEFLPDHIYDDFGSYLYWNIALLEE